MIHFIRGFDTSNHQHQSTNAASDVATKDLIPVSEPVEKAVVEEPSHSLSPAPQATATVAVASTEPLPRPLHTSIPTPLPYPVAVEVLVPPPSGHIAGPSLALVHNLSRAVLDRRLHPEQDVIAGTIATPGSGKYTYFAPPSPLYFDSPSRRHASQPFLDEYDFDGSFNGTSELGLNGPEFDDTQNTTQKTTQNDTEADTIEDLGEPVMLALPLAEDSNVDSLDSAKGAAAGEDLQKGALFSDDPFPLDSALLGEACPSISEFAIRIILI